MRAEEADKGGARSRKRVEVEREVEMDVRPAKRRKLSAVEEEHDEEEASDSEGGYESDDDDEDEEEGGVYVELDDDEVEHVVPSKRAVKEKEAAKAKKAAKEVDESEVAEEMTKKEATQAENAAKLEAWRKAERPWLHRRRPGDKRERIDIHDPQSFVKIDGGKIVKGSPGDNVAVNVDNVSRAFCRSFKAFSVRVQQVLEIQKYPCQIRRTDLDWLKKLASPSGEESVLAVDKVKVKAAMTKLWTTGVGGRRAEILGRESFGPADIIDLPGFTRKILQGWCVYIGLIEYRDGTWAIYIGKSTDARGCGRRVLSYENVLRAALSTIFLTSGRRGFAAAITAKEVKNVWARPLAEFEIPADEKVARALEDDIGVYEGHFCDFTGALDTSQTGTISIFCGEDVDVAVMLMMSQAAGPPVHSLQYRGLNRIAPYAQGYMSQEAGVKKITQNESYAIAQGYLCVIDGQSLHPARSGKLGYRKCPLNGKGLAWWQDGVMCKKCAHWFNDHDTDLSKALKCSKN